MKKYFPLVLVLVLIQSACNAGKEEHEPQAEPKIATNSTYEKFYLSEADLNELKRDAQNGNVLAAKKIGDFYAFSGSTMATSQNLEQALEWYEIASKRGDFESAMMIVKYYNTKGGPIDCDSAFDVLQWVKFISSNEQFEDLSTQSELVRLESKVRANCNVFEQFEHQGEPEVATSSTYEEFYLSETELKQLKKDAQQGNVLAAKKIADFFSYAEGDNQESRKWYMMASELGDPEATIELSNFYKDSDDLTICLTALSLMKKAKTQASEKQRKELFIEGRIELLKSQCSQLEEPNKGAVNKAIKGDGGH